MSQIKTVHEYKVCHCCDQWVKITLPKGAEIRSIRQGDAESIRLFSDETNASRVERYESRLKFFAEIDVNQEEEQDFEFIMVKGDSEFELRPGATFLGSMWISKNSPHDRCLNPLYYIPYHIYYRKV